MGCCSSKQNRENKYRVSLQGAEMHLEEQNVAPGGRTESGTFEQTAVRPDPKDYMFVNITNDKKVKEPGSINGQAFMIDNCEDSQLYVFDHTAQVTVDDCTNCCIFLGPVSGSTFIRDCKNCKIVCLTRQLRTRGCHNCEISLHCSTQPSIESSSEISLGCYDLPYKGLKDQLDAAQMSFFQNHWSYVYDFTPKPGNWSFLPEEATSLSLLRDSDGLRWLSEARNEDVPLVTLRDRKASFEAYAWLLFPPSQAKEALPFAQDANKECKFLFTNMAELSAEHITSISEVSGWNQDKLTKALLPGKCIGIEVCSDSPLDGVISTAEGLGAFVVRDEEAATSFRHLGISGSGR
mmetsp:Transcript_23141/g.55372  ORF Transcript_23141/g.55372 Transcript_23141/m.55372 type:complete len:350 (+) Transcript_23141:177-1226(+)